MHFPKLSRDSALAILMRFQPLPSFSAVPPVILRLAEPEKRHDTCIEFTVRGYPYPKLRWFHKQMEIKENDFIWTDKDTYQDYLEGCLLFKNPTHLNNGNYTLEASNHLGTVTKTVHGHFLKDEIDIGEWTTIFPSFKMRFNQASLPQAW